MSTHAHVAPLAGGLLVTAGARRLHARVPATALADPAGRAQVRAAIEARLGPLVTWPDGAGPGAALGPPGRVWWFGGAWFGCTDESVQDARRVVRTHAPDEATADAWGTPGVGLDLPVAHDPDLDRVRDALGGLPPDTLLRCTGGELTRHRLRPWPECDPVTGAARAVVVRRPEPGLPPVFRHVHALLPRTELGWPAWQADRLAPAAAFSHADPSGRDALPGAAREAALASAVAHLAGPWTGASTVRHASPAELAASGADHLDPQDLAVTDPAVLAHPGSPLSPLEPDRPLAWVQGHRVTDGAPVWVPLRFVHTHADPPPVADQDVSAFHNLAGMAAGRTRDEAVRRGLAHVVSHDAVARWWRSAQAPAPRRLVVPDGLAADWAGAGVRLDLRRVPSRFTWPVVLAVVRDHEHRVLGIGHAAGPLDDAARTAALDALVQLVSARDLDRPDSLVRRAAADGVGAVPGLLDHRPARDYLDAAPVLEVAGAPGTEPLVVRPAALDPMVHLQLGLDPRVQERVAARLGAHDAPSGAGMDAEHHPERAVDPAAHAVVVETTPPALRGGEWSAVRVLRPRALRLEPAAFPLRPPHTGPRERTPYPGW
ncbi:YcaO-like family protein [Oerskovia flava]|uniref:YcaO-like family protein n=1 Tax=Oerskovia flava TaxID=2986422 RepID=UPI00223EF5EB|nr:YcaO-like family protein [Oerskovia sp. JB1-3-2]